MVIRRALLALIEPITVFVLVTILTGALLDLPWSQTLVANFGEAPIMLALRWTPLVAIALLIDLALRRRGFGGWGLFAPWRAPLSDWRALFFLLALGGVPALCLTIVLPPPETGLFNFDQGWRSILVCAATLLSPVLGQELFVCGYAQARFADGLHQWIVALLVAALFGLAHLSHAGAGLLGWAFVGAMTFQGLVWSLARSAGAPLTLLMVAHLLLLAAYENPLLGITAILGGLALNIGRFKAWSKAMMEPAPAVTSRVG